MKFNDPAWQHEFFTANAIRFHAVTEGAGPLALLLHGFPENWFSWRYQLRALARAGYRAVAVDMRGFNESEKPNGVAAYHADHLRRDVVGIIKALGGEPAHLIAHDWGGAVAWDVAAHHPDILRSLSILNAPHPRIFMRRLFRSPRQLRRSWYMFFFQIPWLPERLMRADIDTQFARAFRGWAIRKEMFPDEVIAAFAEPMKRPGALTAGLNYYRAAFRNFRSGRKAERSPNIAVPTQVIWGEDDRALGKELTEGMEHYVDAPYEIHFLPACSHWVQQEYPEETNALLIDFLTRNTPSD
ncbi:MAG: alpha/beta fold hydrolase [Candidatus Lernaella stagnicola]|nr:alpha/beta fold hydrolase [Candidatus Lernaella stagnicola]